MTKRSIALATLATILTAATPGLSASIEEDSAASLTPFFTSGGPLRYARFQRTPPQLVYSGDGAAFVAGRRGPSSRLKWMRWDARDAAVSGDDWRNNCKPYCAAGTYHGYPVRVRLYRRRHVAGRPVFTRMALTYTRTPYPPGIHSSRVTYKFLCGHTGCQDRFWYGPY